MVHRLRALRGRTEASGLRRSRRKRRLRRARGRARSARHHRRRTRTGVTQMNAGDYLEKWGRTMFESPLGGNAKTDEPPELAEIRLAVLDCAREKSYRAGGKKVFPFDLLRVQLNGVEAARREVFAGRFFRQYLEQEVRTALRDSGCRFPDNLRVDVDANVSAVRLDKARINIGRVIDVYREQGLFRRNDLAFPAETEINQTVSR